MFFVPRKQGNKICAASVVRGGWGPFQANTQSWQCDSFNAGFRGVKNVRVRWAAVADSFSVVSESH